MFHLQNSNVCSVMAIALLACYASTATATQQRPLKVQVVANEMCCKGCAQKVAAQLYALPGVTEVRVDVPGRSVSITAKPSPKLTLEGIWQAVEKGKGGPSKLVTDQATYILMRPDSLKPEQRLPAGQYSLQVRSLENKDSAQRIANQLYKVRGVQTVSVDLVQRTLFVQSTSGAVVSLWNLATAAERAQSEPVSVGGPHGLLTIKRTAESQAVAAGRPTNPSLQGEVR